MSSARAKTTVSLYDINDVRPHHCGYCDTDGSVSNGMSCEEMTIEDYQGLIDRGWRRSGTYIYKPNMKLTCCPLYTIKCEALKFQFRKSQKNTIKLVKKFLEKGEKKKEKVSNPNTPSQASNISYNPIQNRTKQPQNTHAKKIMALFLDKNLNLAELKSKTPNEVLNIPKLKSKQVRLYRKLFKLKEQNRLNSFADIAGCLKRKMTKPDADSIENYLTMNDRVSFKNKLELKLVRSWPPSKEFEKSLKEEYEIYEKYQMKIHNDTPFECNLSQFKRFLCSSPLLQDSYNGPLKNIKTCEVLKRNDIRHDIIGDISELGYGSFHQQYILNGKIIAVGVMDILNNCVSSVYFFYDPDYQFLNLGTFSALREIAFVRQLNKLDPNIKWYYLGFYAHTCRKMRYKGLFHPSFLACPEVFTWHSIESCVPLLEANKYSRFAPTQRSADSPNTVVEDQDKLDSIKDVKIKFRTKILRFEEFCDLLNPDYVHELRDMITGYCKLFGKTISNRILIKF